MQNDGREATLTRRSRPAAMRKRVALGRDVGSRIKSVKLINLPLQATSLPTVVEAYRAAHGSDGTTEYEQG